MYRIASLLVALVLGLAAGTAPALGPQEVLVVANKRLPESVELANTYASVRGIPSKNILLVKTATTFKISRVGYEKQIAEPVRQALSDRQNTGIRCVALMWGVPVRVDGPVGPALTPEQQAYKRAADRAHYRLAIAHNLLGSVAVDFPQPRTKSFKPLVDLFTSPGSAPELPLPKFVELRDDIGGLFDEKRRQAAAIEEPAKRRIAWRQLMALQLELRGLKGLAELVRTDAPPTAPDAAQLAKLVQAAAEQLAQLEQKDQTPEIIEQRLKMVDNISGALGLYAEAIGESGAATLDRKKKTFFDRTISATDATVDSELALVLWPEYRLEGWIDNPMYWRKPASASAAKPRLLMTARIDGPSAADAMRIIKASAQTEKTGLVGNFYIDAGGGPSPAFEKNFSKLHALIKSQTKLNVVLDISKPVFASGSCPKAALYVGWYSLRKYVPAFSWTPGSVGWHHASYEAVGLRDPHAQTWCPKMIQNGVAATLGAVAEPLLGSFPLPQDFFALLLTGKYTLAECYWRTVPFASWRLTLIGDPLYRPFAARAELDVSKLPPPLRN